MYVGQSTARGSNRNWAWSTLSSDVPQREQVVDLIDRLALGVEAVQLDVLEGPFDLEPLLFERRRELGLLAAQRERLHHLLAACDRRLGACQLRLHAAAPREAPLGNDDRLALVVVQRVLGEEGADVVDERAVLERVDATGRDLRDRWSALGSGRGDGDDRGDHHVDGDHVDRALRRAGELLQQPTGVGDDHRLRHAEPADPSRPRLGPRRFDDRRTDDADRHVALRLGQRLLTERLGERVGVRPADRRRPCPPRGDELILHPTRPELLGLRRQGRRAGGADLVAGVAAELGELDGLTAEGLGVALEAPGRGDLRLQDRPMSNGPSLTSCSGALPRRLPAT